MVESYLSTKVELFVSARSISNADLLSKSDPFCEISIQGHNQTYSLLHRTEVALNNLNPDWSQSYITDFFFETKQSLKFQIFDYDESSSDSLGFVCVTLGELVAKGTSILKLNTKGCIIIRVQEVKTSRDSFLFSMRGIKLDKKDTFGKSDPYLIFFRSLGNNQWTEVHRTETIKNTLDPIWAPFEISEQHLCNCDREKHIKVECYDYDAVGSHDLIGIFETTLLPLITHGNRFDLLNPQNKNKKAGSIEVMDVVLRKNLSFIDYLRCGVQLSLSIAIDYTGSNGVYTDPSSLHYCFDPLHPNQYERAIWEVGTILEAYDSDKLFPVFGFGGVPPGQHKANHCFALNMVEENPYIPTIYNVLQTYKNSLQHIKLSGPTLFQHIINAAISVASNTPPQSVYHVLLILTDGAIMDMNETVKAIVKASRLPLSIIIVGVGEAEFDIMEKLDSDKKNLVDECGNKAVRDIVQFVPFRQFGGNPIALAAEVLKEVPKQLTDFMKKINFFPMLPEEIPISQITVPVEAHFNASAPELINA